MTDLEELEKQLAEAEENIERMNMVASDLRFVIATIKAENK